MLKLKPGDHNYLTSDVLRLLIQNRITTILEFLQEDIEKLSTITKLSLPAILSIRNDIFKKYSAPLVTGVTLLDTHSMTKRLLCTKIQSLDTALGGGLPLGHITELCGLADSGKTQLCLQLAINCSTYTEGTILYVDTKGDFSATRVQKILDACGHSHKEMGLIMFRIKVVHIWTMEEIIDLFKKLKNKILVFENLNLIIIDSLPCLMFQYLGDDNKIGLSFLNTLVNYIRYLCKEYNLSAVCVNIQTRWVDQDVNDVEEDEEASSSNKNVEKRNRCLGKYWQHIPALLMVMERSEDKDSSPVKITITDNINCKYDVQCILKISDAGVM